MPKKASTFDSEKFIKEFHEQDHLYTRLKDEALFTLKIKLNARKIKYHSIPSRIKTLESCLSKIEQNQYEKPFEQMRDFVGLRIICLFLSDIPLIGEIIRENFTIVESDDKVDGGDTSSFGYMSIHYIVRFGDKYRGDRYDNIDNIPFEIQVR